MVLGVEYDLGDARIRGKYGLRQNSAKNTNTTNAMKLQNQQSDTFVSSLTGEVGSGNTCTDGKDDGKIGFLSALGNVVQGAVRTVPNMIKGMFTDENGNFSLLKTAGTVALGAACVAFPAVGLAACAVGAVAGGAKIVTNVGKAMTAENDAEAKAAWEEVGSGGVVTAMSVAGAKASYGAMEGSLGESAALGNKGLVENIQENGFLQTAKNLKTDATTSVKNNFAEIRDNFSVFKNDINATKNVKEYKELLSKKASGEELSEAEAAKLEEFQYDTKLTEKVNQLEEQEIKVGRAKKQYTKEKEAYDKELAELKQQKSEIETDLEVAGEDDPYFAQNKAELEDVNAKIDELNTNFAKTQSEYDTTMAQNTFGGKVKSAYADSKAKASEMVDSLKGKKFDLAGFKSKLSKENLTDAAISLGTRGKAIINDIMTSDLDGLVEKYGYENLGEILSTISGAVAMDNSV